MFTILATLAGVLSASISGAKWMNVAQKEHYEPGRVAKLAYLWVESAKSGYLLLLASTAFTVLSLTTEWEALLLPAFALAVVIPVGLTSRLRRRAMKWTARARRLGFTLGTIYVAVALACLYLNAPVLLWFAILASPILMDLSLAITRPIERMLSNRYIKSARQTIREVSPKVVAITGSYGKTSTKAYAAHLASTSFSTLASPASFNNVLGLSRSINDKLLPSTEVFIAEMGTYGENEIRRLCELFPPDISAITTIGEAHLERMGSREVIVRAKSEIVEHSRTVVLNVDVPELSHLATQCREIGKRVITCSAAPSDSTSADVHILPPSRSNDAAVLTVRQSDGTQPSSFQVCLPQGAHPINLAIAAGIAVALDVPGRALAQRLGNLPSVEHRATVSQSKTGRFIVDDTFNSNPSGAASALDTALQISSTNGGSVIVVTPGMIELGGNQYERNAEFARLVSDADARLFVVGRTNRIALLSGARNSGNTRVFDERDEAVAAAHSEAREGDVILFENDLPNHYP